MTRWTSLGALLLLGGCMTTRGVYDPGRFADWPIDPAKKVDGCVAVATTPEQDATVWRGGPTGFTGSAIRLEVPLGTITREAAARVFGDLFRGGAVKAPQPEAGACRVRISPRPTRLTWTAHMFSDPTFHVWVWIEATSATGETMVAKEYASGPYRVGPPPFAKRFDAGNMTAGAQIAVQAIMLRAAADVRAELKRGCPTGVPGGCPTLSTRDTSMTQR